MPSIIIDITLPKEEYLRVYESFIRDVRGIARNGQSIRFPVNVLSPFVTHDGVHGTFKLHFDAQNKFVKIERV